MVQARVSSGASGQKIVADYFVNQFKAKIISIAPPGSNVTDIVLQINNTRYNVEVKGTKDLKSDVSIFDLSASRKNNDFYYLNTLAKSMITANSKKIPSAYTGSEYLYGIDLYRLETGDMTVGFPLDQGVTSRGGKLPPFYRSTNSSVLSTTYDLLMKHFDEKDDKFFAIVHNNDVYAWYTGLGSSPIPKVKKLASTNIKSASLASYGVEYYRKDIPEKGIKKGDLRGVLRTALKVKFNI